MIQGDPINWFNEIFYNPTEIFGYFGVLLIIFLGAYFANKKDFKPLTAIWLIFELLALANYLELVEATPSYWWHVVILLFGGILQLALLYDK